MKKYLKYMWSILKHKYVVGLECMRCGLFFRGVVHDISKFSPCEFSRYAAYFDEDKSRDDLEKIKEDYSVAWQHHKGHNPHHWEYWIDFDRDGNISAVKMPYDCVVEMVCDWIGAGKVYNKKSWNENEPMEFYQERKDKIHLHPDTQKLFLLFLGIIRDFGLASFHQAARSAKTWVDYNKR